MEESIEIRIQRYIKYIIEDSEIEDLLVETRLKKYLEDEDENSYIEDLLVINECDKIFIPDIYKFDFITSVKNIFSKGYCDLLALPLKDKIPNSKFYAISIKDKKDQDIKLISGYIHIYVGVNNLFIDIFGIWSEKELLSSWKKLCEKDYEYFGELYIKEIESWEIIKELLLNKPNINGYLYNIVEICVDYIVRKLIFY